MKTASSNRTLPLIPQIEKELLKQKAKKDKQIAYFGKDYNKNYIEYVFTHENGDLFYPDYLSHAFNKLLIKHNLKHIRLHDLRHSCASIMLKSGVQMKQIQEWLGHSNFSTTADIYSHLDFASKIQSAKTIASALNYSKGGIPEVNTNYRTIMPTVPEEVVEEDNEEIEIKEKKEAMVDDELSALKSEMKKLGFTKLSQLFAYFENSKK